jgi:anthranilate synthase component 1
LARHDFPSREEAAGLAAGSDLIPVCREIQADLLTPVGAFLRAGVRHRNAFLLESVEGGESLARYSFLGWSPRMVIRSRGTRIVEEARGKRNVLEGNVFDRIRLHMVAAAPATFPGMPRMTAGAVGYIGWEAANLFENIPAPVIAGPVMDDVVFGLYDNLAVFDHVKQRLLLVASMRVDGPREARRKYSSARKQLDEMELALKASAPLRRLPGPRSSARNWRVRSNVTQAEFKTKVNAIKSRIRAGDAYQVVLSQRFSAPLRAHPFEIYRALRRINPSPYMYYLADGQSRIVGASPEMLIRVNDGLIETRAIAGTRHRGRNEEEDAALARELVSDPKERSEHLMLVDLARNDLGRVSRPGSVKVQDLMSVERYSHVMHMVTRVSGMLRKDADSLDALAACFPAGTVSGAPKLKAMEIIAELERCRRGPYAGGVVYIDASGNLDSCITIRTLVSRGATAHVQAGAGIVADSSPAREYEETCEKAEAILSALRSVSRP